MAQSLAAAWLGSSVLGCGEHSPWGLLLAWGTCKELLPPPSAQGGKPDRSDPLPLAPSCPFLKLG